MIHHLKAEISKYISIIILALLLSAGISLDFQRDIDPIPDFSSDPEPAGKGVEIHLVIDYANPESYSQVISHPGTDEMLVHFLQLNLAEGDTLTLTDSYGINTLTYPGGPQMGRTSDGFWSGILPGDSVQVELQKVSSETSSQYGAVIDHYMYSYSEDSQHRELASPQGIVGGTDDKEYVECYSSSHPDEYANRRPVVKIMRAEVVDSDWVYYHHCTGWRLGAPDGSTGYILTNNHCIDGNDASASYELDDMIFLFNYEYDSCLGGSPKAFLQIDFTRTSFAATSDAFTGKDWTLINVTIGAGTGMDISPYGWLDIDPRTPILNETVYIPQHPGDKYKQLGIFDTDNPDTGLCRVDDVLYEPGWYVPDIEVGYKCDTEGGSSGSPVTAEANHRVIALHHRTDNGGAPTINLGIRMDLLWPDIDHLVKPAEVMDKDGPTGTVSTAPPFTFAWNNETTADHFLFFILDSDGFTRHINSSIDKATYCAGDTCTYTPAIDYPDDDYEWNVKGVNTAGQGFQGTDLPFTVAAVPGPPTLTSPTGVIFEMRPLYVWEPQESSTEYRLFVSHPVVGTVINQWFDESEVCEPGTCYTRHDVHLRTGNHAWQIQGRNSHGGGVWSGYTRFRVFNAAPPDESAFITSHSHREIITETRPTITWNAVARTSWYKIYIGAGGKIYNRYHRAADICFGETCSLDWATYSPLFYPPRGITEMPQATWLHIYIMPVNVAGNGSWTGPVDLWIRRP